MNSPLRTPVFFGALALLVVVAHVGGFLASRARLPSVVGELAAGVVLASIPSVFVRSLRTDALVGACGELGVLLLMFDIGLELRTSDLRRVGVRAFGVASIGVVGTLVLVGLVSFLFHASGSMRGHLFVAATLAATSMGVTGRVLREFGKTQSAEGRLVLAAAVIDDVIGLVLLAFVSSMVGADHGGASTGVGWLAVRAILFLAVGIVVGRLAIPLVFKLGSRVAGESALLVFGLATCLVYGWAASAVGLAPVIGAFCAGLVIQPEDYRPLVHRSGDTLEGLLEPLLAFFVPVFFLLAGLKVDVSAFVDVRVWLLSFAMIAAAMVGKLCAGLGAGRGASKLVVGVAMIPRGEVTLIFAAAGLALLTRQGTPLLPASTFNAVVLTVVATALLPPFALRGLFGERMASPIEERKNRIELQRRQRAAGGR